MGKEVRGEVEAHHDDDDHGRGEHAGQTVFLGEVGFLHPRHRVVLPGGRHGDKLRARAFLRGRPRHEITFRLDVCLFKMYDA